MIVLLVVLLLVGVFTDGDSTHLKHDKDLLYIMSALHLNVIRCHK